MINIKFYFLLVVLLFVGSVSANDSSGRWIVQPYIGISQMSDTSGDVQNVDLYSGPVGISLDSGFVAGLGLAYQYTANFSLEFAWEYRSNDSSVDLGGLQNFDEGNYASNIFFINGRYFLSGGEAWQPYIGAGLSWVQEIDIDLEEAGNELSYSGDGDIGYQFFAGVTYDISPRYQLLTELRYGRVEGIDLVGEAGAAGRFDQLDYETMTLQLGASYQF